MSRTSTPTSARRWATAVTRSTEIDQDEYVGFLDRLPAPAGVVLAYHYPFYLRFLAATAYPGSSVRLVVARDDAGQIAGVLPGLHLRTVHLNVWLSLAYFGPNAGALAPEDPDLVRHLVEAAQADARGLGCASMTIYAPLSADAEPYRAGLEGAEFEVERVSQCLPIPPTGAESVWPGKVRYDIRRARSLGVTARPVADESEADLVWQIYRDNCAEHGIPMKPLEHIRRLFETAGPHGVFLLAEHEGDVIAGLICLAGGGVLSYYLPCSRAGSRALQPGLLLLDRAVEIAQSSGCRLLNFESSPRAEDSVYRFKARCGGEPVPYRTFVKLLTADALETYRALTPAGVAAEAPHAFVVPFDALQ